jgi:signal transduction histidine kinase
LYTDPVLLNRVLGNLIKNALEASPLGTIVTVRSTCSSVGYVFRIHNPTVMEDAVQSQLFQRSFSTKQGKGRGLGTYSVKLLTERYLRGQVAFDSVEQIGTTFYVTLPTSLPNGKTNIDADAAAESKTDRDEFVGLADWGK